MKKKLSKEQLECIEYAKTNGELIRYSGGFWAKKGITQKVYQYWDDKKYFGTNTIRALVVRGIFIQEGQKVYLTKER